MSISNEQRKKLTKELAGMFAKASGHSVKEHGTDQWELAVDALILAIEGIVRAEHEGGPPDAADR